MCFTDSADCAALEECAEPLDSEPCDLDWWRRIRSAAGTIAPVTDDLPPASPPPQRRKSNASVVLRGIGCASVVVLAMGGWIWFNCQRDYAVDDAGMAFLAALRRGDVDAAHALLSARRRAVLSRAELDALTQHPAFRAHGEASLGMINQRHPGYCVKGDLEVGGEDWNLQLFLLEEAGGYQVHSFAIQPPAFVGLADLLPECGYHAGTNVGYSGPPIERTTVPTGP